MGGCHRADAFERPKDSPVCPGCNRPVTEIQEELTLPYARDAEKRHAGGFQSAAFWFVSSLRVTCFEETTQEGSFSWFKEGCDPLTVT